MHANLRSSVAEMYPVPSVSTFWNCDNILSIRANKSCQTGHAVAASKATEVHVSHVLLADIFVLRDVVGGGASTSMIGRGRGTGVPHLLFGGILQAGERGQGGVNFHTFGLWELLVTHCRHATGSCWGFEYGEYTA